MKNISSKRISKPILLVALGILTSFMLYIVYSNSSSYNFLNNENINRGVGWTNNQSNYSGSELSFAFSKSGEIEFEFESDSISDQGVKILVDDKIYTLSSPNLDAQKLSISVDKNKSHTLVVRHFCTYFYDPCEIKLKGIYLNKNAKITHYKAHNKILSILGDSISTNYGKNNYSQYLANNLGYELHNASILGSTVSKVKDVDNAITRYKNDLMNFKSDVTIIFLGSNDAANSVPLDKFEKNYSQIVSDLIQFNPDGKMFIVGLLPRKDINYEILNNYNKIIQKIGEEHELVFIDPVTWLDEDDFSDDVHPSLESQKELANYFQEILKSQLK